MIVEMEVNDYVYKKSSTDSRRGTGGIIHIEFGRKITTGWPILKQAACHGLFQNGPKKIYSLIGLTSFKMGQITHWAITNKHVQYCYSTLCRLLVNHPSRRNHRLQLNTQVYTNYDCQSAKGVLIFRCPE